MDNQNHKELIFALDIGTHSVIGVAGYKEDHLFHLCCMEEEEYKTRVVVDGQIDDIAQTAMVADIVKTRMEEKLQQPLNSVYIAAAGRSLRTVEVSVEMPVEEGSITETFRNNLEFTGVEKALEEISQEQERAYYYVGHTVQ